jgi:TRAP-type C4-dicarboxylate transport system substrate-binding protein
MDAQSMNGCIRFLILAAFFHFPIQAQGAPPGVVTLKYCEFQPFQDKKFSDRFRASASRTEAVKKTLIEIEKRTAGRIKHSYRCEKSFVRGMDFLSAIKVGKYDLGGGPNILFQPERFPVWQYSQLMFLGDSDPWAALKAWNEFAFTNLLLREELERQGMKFLGAFSYPSVLINRKPLRKPENLKGMKLRAMGQEAKWVVSLGGTVVPIINYEVEDALREGIIDGVMGYPYVLHNYHSQVYCKFLIRTPLANPVIYDTWINLDTWGRMPADLQKIYEETWREFYPQMAVEYGRAEVASFEKAFKDAGVRFLDLTPDQYQEWKASSAFLVNRYTQKMDKLGVDGKKIIEDFGTLYGKYQQKGNTQR